MSRMELADRMNWQQAADYLGCSKSHLYRLTSQGKIRAYGDKKRCRFWLKSELKEYMSFVLR